MDDLALLGPPEIGTMILNEARKHPECSRVRDVYVTRLTSPPGSWDYGFVFSRAFPAECYVVLGPAVADLRRRIRLK
jgi:hypothetical protein